MKRNLVTSILYTAVATLLLGVVYPLVVTGLAQVLAKDRANGQLIKRDGVTIGSRILAQPFSSARYFHARPSAAGTNGYDATNSGGTNWGPTNQKLIDRIKNDTATLQSENPGKPVPVDLVTDSASGLDPHITPAAAEFQIARVARARGVAEDNIRKLVTAHTELRQFGFLGEPRVNVLELNLALDQAQRNKASGKSLAYRVVTGRGVSQNPVPEATVATKSLSSDSHGRFEKAAQDPPLR